MTELSNEVVALEFNKEDGSFKELQYIPTIPADFTENSQGGAIRITSDGKFVYASNRGHNSIAIFQINEENGELTFVDYASSEGNWRAISNSTRLKTILSVRIRRAEILFCIKEIPRAEN